MTDLGTNFSGLFPDSDATDTNLGTNPKIVTKNIFKIGSRGLFPDGYAVEWV